MMAIAALQAERQKAGQERAKRTGCTARVNRNRSNGTTAPSGKSFTALHNVNQIKLLQLVGYFK
jgi:hypothetical protein